MIFNPRRGGGGSKSEFEIVLSGSRSSVYAYITIGTSKYAAGDTVPKQPKGTIVTVLCAAMKDARYGSAKIYYDGETLLASGTYVLSTSTATPAEYTFPLLADMSIAFEKDSTFGSYTADITTQ